ncbi:hypothetical protein JCM1393_05920 [Clostridium carnis]
MTITKSFKNHKIHCTYIKMGTDYNISIFGGDKPHIGAVALGIPRPSLSNPNKISSSVSILTITGHKEDEIARRAAKVLSQKLNVTVVVSCGIHIDNLTFEDLNSITLIVDEILSEF